MTWALETFNFFARSSTYLASASAGIIRIIQDSSWILIVLVVAAEVLVFTYGRFISRDSKKGVDLRIASYLIVVFAFVNSVLMLQYSNTQGTPDYESRQVLTSEWDKRFYENTQEKHPDFTWAPVLEWFRSSPLEKKIIVRIQEIVGERPVMFKRDGDKWLLVMHAQDGLYFATNLGDGASGVVAFEFESSIP